MPQIVGTKQTHKLSTVGMSVKVSVFPEIPPPPQQVAGHQKKFKKFRYAKYTRQSLTPILPPLLWWIGWPEFWID